MGTNGTTAALYLRISSDPEGERAGVTRQREDCEQLAARLGLDVVAIHEDNDISAYSGKARPAFESMLTAAQAGEFDVLVVWAADRLYRRMADLVRITSELAPHVRILTVVGGEIDLTTADGIMNAQIHGSVAEYESRHKADRIARRAKQRAKDGVMTASTRPSGWTWADACDAGSECRHGNPHAPGERARVGTRAGLVIEPTEAAILADCYRRIVAGDTVRSAYRYATAAGLAVSGPDVLRTVLLNPRNAGRVAHRGAIVAEAANGLHIIDAATYDRAVAILSDPTRRTSPGKPAGTRLGGGIAVCPRCGGNLAGTMIREDHGRVANYICSKHRHYRRVRATVDPLVLDLVGDTLAALAESGRLSVTATEDTAAAAIREEIATTEARLTELAALAAAGDLTPADYALVSKNLRARMDDLAGRLSRRTGRPALASLAGDTEGLRAAWGRLAAAEDPEPLRAVLRELLVRVVPDNDGSILLEWQEWTDLPPETVRYVKPRPAPPAGVAARRAKVAEAHGRGLHTAGIAAALGLRWNLVAAGRAALGLEPHRDTGAGGPQAARRDAIAARRAKVAELRAAGESQAAIARHLGVGVATVARDLDALGCAA